MNVTIDGVPYYPKPRLPKGKPCRLGEQLRFSRETNRWSLDEVSRKTRLSKTYLWELEKGAATDPSFSVIVRLAKLYGIELDVLAATVEIKGRSRL